MLKTKLFSAATIAAILMSISPMASAGLLLHISDDGTDLTMRATGSYDLSAVSGGVAFGAPGSTAFIASSFTYGWHVPGAVLGYDVSFDDFLTIGDSIFDATSVTTNTPFFFANLEIVLDRNASTVGTVDETAVFAGTTLADLGMISGETVTATWTDSGLGNNTATITTSAVPEPTSLVLLGVASATVLTPRRRRASMGQ